MCVYRVTGSCISVFSSSYEMRRAVSLESTNDRKGKHFIRLLELQEVAPKAKSCRAQSEQATR